MTGSGGRDGVRELEHHARETLELVDGLAFGAKRHEEAADLPGRGLAAHDPRIAHAASSVREGFAPRQTREQFGPQVLAHEARHASSGGGGRRADDWLHWATHAGVVQWQNASFPSLKRGFDSPHPLFIRCSA